MEELSNPPSMNNFPEVYIEAINRLQERIAEEDHSITVFENNNLNLNEMVMGQRDSGHRIQDQRQFIFQINTIEGIFSRDLIFQLRTNLNDTAEIKFQDISEGDAVLPLSYNSENIIVSVLGEENREVLYNFQIDFEILKDRKRHIQQSQGQAGSSEVFIEYEAQLIDNEHDYHKGLLLINSMKIEEAKANKYEFTKMLDELNTLFKNQTFRVSAMPDPSLRASGVPVTAPSFEVSGTTPILKNSQIRNSIVNVDFKQNKKPTISEKYDSNPKELGVYSSQAKVSVSKKNIFSRVRSMLPTAKLSWNMAVDMLFLVCTLLLVVSFLVNWDRASFLSIFMAIVYTTWYFVREEFDTLIPAWFLLVGFLMAFVSDLTWLILSSSHLWSSIEYINDGTSKWIDRFMIIMTYILVATELAAAALCVYLQWKGMFTKLSEAALKTPIQFAV